MNEGKKLKDELKKKYEEEKVVREGEERKQQLVKQAEKDPRDNFFKRIELCDDFEHSLNSISEELKQFINATGVYVSTYDKKRKIPVSEEEDENAHLIDEKVIRYIHFCDDHSFLKNKFLEPNVGITYELFAPKEDDPVDGSGGNNNNNDAGNNNDLGVNDNNNFDDGAKSADDKEKKETLPNHKFVEEVVTEPKMKFFREPRLGCYLAIDMTYKSSLNVLSLYSAISELTEYNQNVESQEIRRKEYDDKIGELKKDKNADSSHHDNTNNNISHNDGPDGVNSNLNNNNMDDDIPAFDEPKVELKEFKKDDRIIIFSLDTLGQDRIFTETEKAFIFETVKKIKNSWESLENSLLLKDRDLKIEMDHIEKLLKEQNPVEKLESEEEKFVKEYFASEKFVENPITDERVKAFETDMTKSKFIIKSFFEDEQIHKLFLMFSQFEFVENERLFQNILYFIGVSNLDINEENTNKLEWKKAKKFWNVKVLEKLRDYNPIGPKPEKLPSFQMLNRILVNLDIYSSKRDELKEYSFVLNRLLDYVFLVIKIRRDDILRRREYIDDLNEKRRLLNEQKTTRDTDRANVIETQKNTIDEQTGEPIEFNEEEYMAKWDEERPEIIIPDEVFYDEDNDFDFEKLAAA
jgi:hypothetical protein